MRPHISISFTVSDMTELEAVRERAKRAIRQSRKIGPGKDDDFKIEAADSFVKQFEQIASSTTFVVGGVVGISLASCRRRRLPAWIRSRRCVTSSPQRFATGAGAKALFGESQSTPPSSHRATYTLVPHD